MAAFVSLALGAPARGQETQIDGFESLASWSATASPGATVEVGLDEGVDGQAMRIDFDLGTSGGFIILRKQVNLDLPENYLFAFQIRGEAPPNNLELKLVDPQGDNVWWMVERDFEFPKEWTRFVVRKSRFGFAWGSSQGAPLRRVGFIEFAISAGSGGKGSVWLDELTFGVRPAKPRTPPKPRVTASTSIPGHPPDGVLDNDPLTSWHSGSVAEQQWLLLDFRAPRELGGIIIDWDREDFPTVYRVELSDDGEHWVTGYRSETGTGRRAYIYLRDAETRYLRLVFEKSSREHGYGIRGISIQPVSFSATPNHFFSAIASEAVPGFFPKYFGNVQTYWTVVGVPGDAYEALINEEGMVEVDQGAFSIEPFLFTDGELVTWQAVDTEQRLEDGYLPIPTVVWQHPRVGLEVTPLAVGEPGSSLLLVRYRVKNTSDTHQDILLFAAIRPFQVLPPWQALNMVGGVTLIREITSDERSAVVNQNRRVVSLTPPERFGAATFEEDLLSTYLLGGRIPPHPAVEDPTGFASGAFEYRLSLEPQAHADVVLAVPWPGASVPTIEPGRSAAELFEQKLREIADEWRRELSRVEIEVPPDQEHLVRTVKSTLAYIQINRDGPAIQPGSRNYARSWIRDGAFTAGALLDFGAREEVRAFLKWFAEHQFEDGRIPCCIDRRGADRVPENDSNGEFLYTVAEYYRFTRDPGFVWEIWPAVVRAVEFIEAQRATRLTAEYDSDDKLVFRGLMPESISHEGYSANPVHSYWDDFFTLRGLRDAVDLARAVDDHERARHWAELRDAFRNDLYASIERTIAKHGIDYLPGSAELGDFDATSTAAAISPVGELANLPAGPLAKTFDRYMEYVRERATRPPGEEQYSPYELRNVAALIMMGRRDDALELLELLMADRRPEAWNQWAEVVWRDPDMPRFIGDMPHTWVGASFMRSVRTMYAYERENDAALVLAAGLPLAWLPEGGPGVGVKRLPTHYGVLHYRLRRDGPNALLFEISGDLEVPAGGIVLDPPLPAPLAAVKIDGAPQDVPQDGVVVVRRLPAAVRLEWTEPAAGAAQPGTE
ncbi:MAG TPA: discoidin domain-containing protein [Candidatus Binatia bacterium]